MIKVATPFEVPLLLDTNILVHAVRNDTTGQDVKQRFGLLVREQVPYISVISDGELRSLAYQFRWGQGNIDQALFFLDYFDRLTIDDPDIVHTYAVIDNVSRGLGVKMGKNDLWIAATAHVIGAKLLTTDADFTHLPPELLQVERITLRPSP